MAYLQRQKPQGGGAIDYVTAVDVPGQNLILVALTFRLRTTAENPLWVHTLKAQLTAADGKVYEDEAASAIDFDRYFQAFPALKEHTQPALMPEIKFLPGQEQTGTVIVSFPISKDTFDKRKKIALTIQPYNQVLPVVLSK